MSKTCPWLVPGFTECSRKTLTQQLPRLVQTGNLVLLQLPSSANCIETAVLPEPQHGLGRKGEDTFDPYNTRRAPHLSCLSISNVYGNQGASRSIAGVIQPPRTHTNDPLGAIKEEEEVRRRTRALETCREDRQQCTQVNQSRRRLGLW